MYAYIYSIQKLPLCNPLFLFIRECAPMGVIHCPTDESLAHLAPFCLYSRAAAMAADCDTSTHSGNNSPLGIDLLLLARGDDRRRMMWNIITTLSTSGPRPLLANTVTVLASSRSGLSLLGYFAHWQVPNRKSCHMQRFLGFLIAMKLRCVSGVICPTEYFVDLSSTNSLNFPGIVQEHYTIR